MRVELQIVTLQGAEAEVRVVTQPQPDGQPYRQTRFYRETDQGWLRTPPVAELWGPPRRLETAYFVWDYRQKDAAVVAKAAPKLDALYTTLRRNFGLDAVPATDKQRLVVSVTQPPGQLLSGLHPAHPSWSLPLRFTPAGRT